MAWDGYFTFNGDEFINISRTLTYARALQMYWVKDPRYNPYIGGMVSDDPYTSPTTDPAPWFDPDDPNSHDFAGVLPIEISGIEDSTRTASTFDYTYDGGRSTGIRSTAKEITFSVALIGKSEAAVEYGLRWLKRVLQPHRCVPGRGASCQGHDMVYARSVPKVSNSLVEYIYDGGRAATINWDGLIDGNSSGDWLDGGSASDPINILPSFWPLYETRLRDVVNTRGVKVTGKREISGCGGMVWLASWTMTAGDPYEYGVTKAILAGMGGTSGSPYVEGLSGNYGSATYYRAACPTAVYTPIYDPACPALVTPPAPPRLKIGCMDASYNNYDRKFAEIPSNVIPLWDEVRPLIHVTSGPAEVRDIEVRIFAGSEPGEDNCGPLSQFYISYIPAYSTLTIDNARATAYIVDYDGNARRADSLIMYDTVTPPVYVGLSCGDSYTITLDRAQGLGGNVDLSLELIGRSA